MYDVISNSNDKIDSKIKRKINSGINRRFNSKINQPLDNTFVDRIVHSESTPVAMPIETEMNRIARFIGRRYEQVSPLLKTCKQAINGSGHASMLLSGASPTTIRDCCQLGRDLERCQILPTFDYDRRQRLLTLDAPSDPSTSGFMTGGWFERYVYQELSHYFASQHSVAQIYPNAHLVTRGGHTYEIDILLIVNDCLLLIECTTGSCGDHIPRLDKKRHLLKLGKSQALMISAHSSDDYVREQTSVAGIVLTNRLHFLEKIEEAVIASSNMGHSL